MRTSITVLALAILFQSCATILGGNQTGARVKDGLPANAKVYYNGKYEGTAPCRIMLYKQDKEGKVEIKADGYKTQTVKTGRKISVGFLIADVLCGLFPLAIDFATGNIYRPYPRKITYDLEKEGVQ